MKFRLLIMLLLICISVNAEYNTLSKYEDKFLSNPDQPQIVAKYGEELYKHSYIFDSVVYIEKALDLGYRSRLYNDIKLKSSQGLKIQRTKIANGYNGVISNNGIYVAYISKGYDKGKLKFELSIYDIRTKQSRILYQASTGQIFPKWSFDNNKIAFIDYKKLVVLSLPNNSCQIKDLTGYTDNRSITWLNKQNSIAITVQEKGKLTTYIYNLLDGTFEACGDLGEILGYLHDSSGYLVYRNNNVLAYNESLKSPKQLFSVNNNVLVECWSGQNNIGGGFLKEKGGGERYYGNEPLLISSKGTKNILRFPHCYSLNMGINTKGDISLITEGTGFSSDLFSVLWVVTTDGTRYATVDSGEIEFASSPFDERTNSFVYSKEVDYNKSDLYLVTVKKDKNVSLSTFEKSIETKTGN